MGGGGGGGVVVQGNCRHLGFSSYPNNRSSILSWYISWESLDTSWRVSIWKNFIIDRKRATSDVGKKIHSAVSGAGGAVL